MPKSALPPDVRAKLGFKRKVKGDENGGDAYWKPGFGNNQVVRGQEDTYHAGNQKKFLRRRSGQYMSQRASRAAQLRNSGKAVLGRRSFNTGGGHVAATHASVSTKMIDSAAGRNTAAMAAPDAHPECRQPVNKPPRHAGGAYGSAARKARGRRRRPRPAATAAAGAHALDAAPEAGTPAAPTNQELSPGAAGKAGAAKAEQAAAAARAAAARVAAHREKEAKRRSLANTPQQQRSGRVNARGSSVRKSARRQSSGGTWR